MNSHNHIFQAAYPDSLLEDCPACANIRPEVMSKQAIPFLLNRIINFFPN